MSDLCPSVDKKRRNIAFSLYAHASDLGFIKFTILVNSSLFIITIFSVCLIYACVYREYF